jgi:hypothetical protein
VLTSDHHLVHFNLAIARHRLDDPRMDGFVSQLDAVKRLAARSSGFVWTAADGEAGDAAATFGSELALPHISTWRSLPDLGEPCSGEAHRAKGRSNPSVLRVGGLRQTQQASVCRTAVAHGAPFGS